MRSPAGRRWTARQLAAHVVQDPRPRDGTGLPDRTRHHGRRTGHKNQNPPSWTPRPSAAASRTPPAGPLDSIAPRKAPARPSSPSAASTYINGTSGDRRLVKRTGNVHGTSTAACSRPSRRSSAPGWLGQRVGTVGVGPRRHQDSRSRRVRLATDWTSRSSHSRRWGTGEAAGTTVHPCARPSALEAPTRGARTVRIVNVHEAKDQTLRGLLAGQVEQGDEVVSHATGEQVGATARARGAPAPSGAWIVAGICRVGRRSATSGSRP